MLDELRALTGWHRDHARKALRKVWAVLEAPSGKRLAPFLPEIVDRLIACGELNISPETRYRLLKAQIPIRTWADWNDAVPGFVEIDLVGHEGGNPAGEFAHTLTVTDIATGWTENRAVRNKAQKWVLAALTEIVEAFPFPVLGIDSDNGSVFINAHLLKFCQDNERPAARSSPSVTPSPPKSPRTTTQPSPTPA